MGRGSTAGTGAGRGAVARALLRDLSHRSARHRRGFAAAEAAGHSGASDTCNTRQDGRDLLAEAAAIPLRPHTTVYPLADANRALEDLKNDRIQGTGVLVVETAEM